MGELEQFLRSRQQKAGTVPEGRRAAIQALRRKIQAELTEAPEFKGLSLDEARPLVEQRAWELVQNAADGQHQALVLSVIEKSEIVQRIISSMFGLGPIEEPMQDPQVTEIMVNGPKCIFVERRTEGHKSQTGLAKDRFGDPLEFDDDTELLTAIERIVAPINRKVDESTPIVDGRLKDGSRVNVVLKPISLDGHAVTIRRFPEPITIPKLVEIGSLPQWLADLLEQMVKARYNIVISGGTGSGKTTFLNALSQFIPPGDRVVTVEDSAELKLQQVTNIVKLEARPANLEGKGAIAIRDLVRTSLRMRPDRIIVGEVRGGEALDMLQAMNTGHDGSMTTGHANSAQDMVSRLETMVMMNSDVKLPLEAVRRQIGSAVDFIVQLSRMPDRSRKVVQLAEILQGEQGDVMVRDLLVRRPNGTLETTGHTVAKVDKFTLARISIDSPLVHLEQGG
ncbi:MAG TPA: CpaF family protein [Symbiobacteriaceae bacterium]|jgi:pilus assembly protein CpaF